MTKSQLQLYYETTRKTGQLDELFMEMINDPVAPLTRAELARLIAKRPLVYSRYKGFLDTMEKV